MPAAARGPSATRRGATAAVSRGSSAKRIKDGTLTTAINQQPFLQAYFAVANLANKAKYNLSPANVDTGTSIVTKDNIDTVQACIDAGRC